MNKKIVLSLIAFIALVGIIVPVTVSAQGAPDQCTIDLNSAVSGWTKAVDGLDCPISGDCPFDSTQFDCGVCCLLNSVFTVTNWIFIFLMALSALMIIVGAFNYVTSAGDTTKTTAGRNYIMYAAIGIAIALFARAIPAIVKLLIGMN